LAQSTPAATPNADCNPGKLIDTFAKLKKTGDADKDSAALQTIEDAIEINKAACAGLEFKGTKQQVVGPITIPTGSYKAVATTKGFLIIHTKVDSGDCTNAEQNDTLFNIGSGEANTGAETLFDSKDCKMFLITSNVSAPWSLVFEPMQ
jgi:hypothetical protein